MLILQFRSLSPSKRLPIKSVVLKIPHMLRLVIFYQDGKAAGVYFGLLAKGGADNQVLAVVQDNLRGLLLTHAAVVQHIGAGFHQLHAAAVKSIAAAAQAGQVGQRHAQSKYARLNGSR